MPDENGKTRRERNDLFGVEAPIFSIPQTGRYLWDWYFDLSDSLRRVRGNVCEPFPPSEFAAWRDLNGEIIYPVEYNIIREMDKAFCEEMNNEMADYRVRLAEEAKEANSKRGLFGRKR